MSSVPPPEPSPRHAAFTKTIVPAELASAVDAMASALGVPVWLLVQNGDGRLDDLNPAVWRLFRRHRNQIPSGGMALLIDSPGGFASTAYKIARLLQKRSGTFIAIVPQYAKSAATLLALGAQQILMGESAELGPLDAQFIDREREKRASALEEVQALERLQAAALNTVDQAGFLLVQRTAKRTDVVLPSVMHFTADLMRPLFEKIDVVRYSERSRMLKVAEEYANRLLRSAGYSSENVGSIARRLVEDYPEHGFVIDREEAQELGLKIESPSSGSELSRALDLALDYLDIGTHIGPLIGTAQGDRDDDDSKTDTEDNARDDS